MCVEMNHCAAIPETNTILSINYISNTHTHTEAYSSHGSHTEPMLSQRLT